MPTYVISMAYAVADPGGGGGARRYNILCFSLYEPSFKLKGPQENPGSATDMHMGYAYGYGYGYACT